MNLAPALQNWLIDHAVFLLGAFSFSVIALWNVAKRSKHHVVAKKVLQKAIDTQSHEPLTLHPEINPALCAGCGSCTKACPEGSILQLINHKAVLVAPTKCVGHGECERVCPTNAISLVFGTKTRGMEIPRISADFETNVPGLYIAGELGGMGLIRNAVKQGHMAADHALKKLGRDQAHCDLLIVGAGPAGLAAALTAIAAQKSYLLLDQNTFGGTVANFPRQKLVMSQPASLPIVGAMKFPKNKVSKEELLAYWKDVQSKTGLKVHEKVRFESLEQKGNVFHVKTTSGLVVARKVILAMGVRGSPRKLGLENEDHSKVAYNLIDPEQYQGQQVVVVGGGNAGVEAAQMLAKPEYRNHVRLLVRGAAFDRCNDENKRIIEEMAAAGLVTIQFKTSVKKILDKQLVLESDGKLETVANDFIFVYAGAELPFKFLMSLGIKIDKKFGESLQKSKGAA